MISDALGELKPIARLAAPLIVAFFGYQLIGLVDTFVSGQLGVEVLAATSLANALFWVITIFPMGMLMGLDPIVAQALGAGRPRRAWLACRDGIFMALVLSLITVPLLWYAALPGWPWSPEGSLSDSLLDYMSGRIYCAPLLFVHTCVRCFLQSHERGGLILLGTALSNVLNLFLSVYLGGGDLLLARFGLPELGWLESGYGAFGVGLASSIVLSIEVVLLTWRARQIGLETSSVDLESLPTSDLSKIPMMEGWRELARVGAPVGGSMLSEGGVFSASTLIVSAWSPIVIGAHQVTLQLASMTFIISLGVANATAVRVGQAVGAEDWARARGAGLIGIIFSLLVMCSSALCFLFMGASLAGLITQNHEVIKLATELLLIAAAFQLFDGIQVTAAAALRGAGFTKIPLYSAMFSHWGVGLPIALGLAFYAEMGVHGLWWGLCGGLISASLILTSQFFSLTRPIAQGHPLNPNQKPQSLP